MKAVSTVLICSLALSTIGCGNIELQSRQKDRVITVDGNTDDWEGALEPVEKAGFSFGLMNDHKHLYIATAIADQAKQRQIMMCGLYLWFDETARKEKHFSVNFPIGMLESGMSPVNMMREDKLSDIRDAFLESTNELLIAADEGEWQRFSVGSLERIEVAAGFVGSVMALEFKVPLAKSGPYGFGVGAGAGSAIGLGVESVEPNMEQMRRGMPGRPAGMGGPGGRGGGPPGMGGGPEGRSGPGRMGGQRPERPQPFELWMKVILLKDAM